MTPRGFLLLGISTYLLALLGLYVVGELTVTNTTPCLLRQSTTVKCPLCGGTNSLLMLASGKVEKAVQLNPMVSLGVPIVCIMLITRYRSPGSCGIRMTSPLLICCLLAIVTINWAYVLSRPVDPIEERPLAVRHFLELWMQR